MWRKQCFGRLALGAALVAASAICGCGGGADEAMAPPPDQETAATSTPGSESPWGGEPSNWVEARPGWPDGEEPWPATTGSPPEFPAAWPDPGSEPVQPQPGGTLPLPTDPATGGPLVPDVGPPVRLGPLPEEGLLPVKPSILPDPIPSGAGDFAFRAEPGMEPIRDPGRYSMAMEPASVEPHAMNAPPASIDGPMAPRSSEFSFSPAERPSEIAGGDPSSGGVGGDVLLYAPDMAPPDEGPSLEPPQPQPAPPPEPAVNPPAEPAIASSPDEPAAAEEEKDYNVVTVFYGTDRQAIDGPTAKGRSAVGWFYPAGIIAGIAGLLFGLALWRRRRWLVGLACVGVAASLGLAVLGVLAFLQDAFSGPGPKLAYGNERGELQMGTCEVTIPKRHEVGQVERPSVFHFEFTEDPTKHVVLTDVQRLEDGKFYGALRDRVSASPRKEAFVFIHGYNVTFEAAARRTAQLAFDLKFDGAPIFYSWPSQGGILQYSVDETNAAWTVPDLKQFLTAVAEKSGAESVHVIAHSMGNRALGSALQALAYEHRDREPLFKQVVLTAPDIDADVFKREIAPAIVNTAERITLYASSNDKALALSKQVHRYPRAGDSGAGLVVVPGIDTIDVSDVDTSLLGHSYYGSNDTVLADLVDLLNGAKPPAERRFLHPMRLGELAYWAFVTKAERIGSALGAPPAVR